MEPRDAASRATDVDYSVVWLNGTNREMALHKLKMATHGLSFVCLKHRYGIRVLAQHEEKTYQELRPGDNFVKVKVTSVYRLHPFPYGIQRAQVTALLKQRNWAAKPLQPARGTSEGSAWDVGTSEAPKEKFLTAFDRDILITLIKDKIEVEKTVPVIGPKRVQAHLNKTAQPSFSSSGSMDRWLSGPDPWTSWHAKQQNSTLAAPSKRIDALADQLESEVKNRIAKAPTPQAAMLDSNQEQLETGMV